MCVLAGVTHALRSLLSVADSGMISFPVCLQIVCNSICHFNVLVCTKSFFNQFIGYRYPANVGDRQTEEHSGHTGTNGGGRSADLIRLAKPTRGLGISTSHYTLKLLIRKESRIAIHVRWGRDRRHSD